MDDVFKSTEKVAHKAVKGLRHNIGYFSIILISAVFLFVGFFDINATGQTVLGILISSALTLMVGVSITKGWAKQGLIEGGSDPINQQVIKDHARKVKEATPYFKYADEWSALENKLALRDARYNILMRQGLYYNDYFDADGRFVGKYKLLKEASTRTEKLAWVAQNRTIKEAVVFKVTPLTVTALTSGLNTSLDRNFLGLTEVEFEKKKGKQDIWMKIAISLVFGMFTLRTVENPDWSSFMYSALQVGLFQVGGVVAYYTRYIFKVRDEVDTYTNKITKLDQLERYGKAKEVKVDGNNTTINATTT